jgi:hypothetical protein
MIERGLVHRGGVVRRGRVGTAAAGREARAALEASGLNYDAQFTVADLALFEGCGADCAGRSERGR